MPSLGTFSTPHTSHLLKAIFVRNETVSGRCWFTSPPRQCLISSNFAWNFGEGVQTHKHPLFTALVYTSVTQLQPGIGRGQALADISRSALCCHTIETRAPIANPPNSAQLGGTPYHSPELHPGLCSSVGMRRGTETDKQTDRHTDGRDQYTFRVVYDSREM